MTIHDRSPQLNDRASDFDVIVVGARCAGSPLAVHLALAGLAVVVVDRADFPSDAFSTHLFQVSGAACLDRLGVLDAVRATGAPCLEFLSVNYDQIDFSATVRRRPGDPDGGFSVRRRVLDKILVDAARNAGADVRLRTKVIDLLRDGGPSGRVTGVRVSGPDGVHDLRARLVVGADGRMSTVGKLVDARTYNVTTNERFVYWADFEGVVPDGPAAVHHYRDGEHLTIGFFSDSGLFTVMVEPPLAYYEDFRGDIAAGFDAAVARCEPLRPILASARRVSRPIGTASLQGFFRESAGPGWVLVGDAGHFKDPTLGQGISDALRQVERLSAALTSDVLGDPAALDRVVRKWWRWRDRDAAAMYWLVADSAKAAPFTALERAILRRIAADPRSRQRFVDDVLAHRCDPRRVMTPAKVLGAAWATIRLRDAAPAVVGRELAVRVRAEIVRTWWIVRPRYQTLAPIAERSIPVSPTTSPIQSADGPAECAPTVSTDNIPMPSMVE